ncbi:MAG: biopolymer transporter ExbD [Gemmatimonadetes bacterium]|nr:biopolymer transporter ExbD [Gemmatimonadota bacterium]
MSRRRYRSGEIDPGLSVRAEVNLVNLVDVALVLLVIFMITAPMLQGGVEVALPRADVPPITSQEDGLIVTVTKDGKIFVEETEVAPGAFADEFPQLLVGSKAKFVYIKADQEAMYGDVLRVVATVHRAEGVRMGLLGEPTPRR